MVPSDNLEDPWAALCHPLKIHPTSTNHRTGNPLSLLLVSPTSLPGAHQTAPPLQCFFSPVFFLFSSPPSISSSFQVGSSPHPCPPRSRCSEGVFTAPRFRPQVSRCAAERQVNGGLGNVPEPGLGAETAALAQKAWWSPEEALQPHSFSCS